MLLARLVNRPLLLTVAPIAGLACSCTLPVGPCFSEPLPPCPCWHPVLVLAAVPASRHCPFVMTRHRRTWASLEGPLGGCRFLLLLRLGPATALVAEVMGAAAAATAAATVRTCLPCLPQRATSLTAHLQRPRRQRGRGTRMHLRGLAAAAAARGYRSPLRRAPFSRRRGLGEGAPEPGGWPVPLRPAGRQEEGVPFFLTLAVASGAEALFPRQGNEVRLRGGVAAAQQKNWSLRCVDECNCASLHVALSMPILS